MHPTLVGRMVLAAFKLPQAQIELKLADARTLEARYIPEIGQSGFMLSPYVASAADFAMMAGGLDKDLRVRQIMIMLRAPELGLWAPAIDVSLQTLNIPPQRDLQRLLLTEPTAPPAALASGKMDQVEDCSLDTVGGQLFSSLKQPISVGTMQTNVGGWTAPSAAKGIGPDETWISLASANAPPRFYHLKTTARPDVRAFFKQPDMKEPGFTANLDLEGLSGTQALTILRGDKQGGCPSRLSRYTIYSLRGGEAFRCRQHAVLHLSASG